MMEQTSDQKRISLSYRGHEVEVQPYFAYESSIPQVDRKKGKYLISKCPVGHLIINFCVKLHLPAHEIPISLDPNEVQAAAWMSKSHVE